MVFQVRSGKQGRGTAYRSMEVAMIRARIMAQRTGSASLVTFRPGGQQEALATFSREGGQVRVTFAQPKDENIQEALAQ